MSCIFCKIIDGEIPCTKVYEDDLVLAFNDINPAAPYHILVIPKKHYETIVDIPENEMQIVAHVHNVINNIANKKGFSETGFRIINNCKEDGGQEVKHVHYHVLAGKKLPMYESERK